ncbi:MAG: formimidoylglutamate deiminase [Notoacmeibacter sp.]|nr:formimidoylglutamate deiminase [Notoacmeibacter sp.]
MEHKTFWAGQALTAQGWRSGVRVEIGADGRIIAVEPDTQPQGARVGVLLPAPANLHSHAFQRAMAGLTERRGPDPRDSFWTWRALMYRFLERLTPDDVEAIAAFVQMEMLEAGYAAVAEFHYLHHQADGRPYDNPAEMAERIAAAARLTGIGLTLLPVLYEQGGCDGRPLGPGQIRFGCDVDGFTALLDATRPSVAALGDDAVLGVAPHSLRAVSHRGLAAAIALIPDAPLHMHIAEQTGEVEEVEATWGMRPVEWLFDNHDVDERWCLIHCTHMRSGETRALAASGAVAGLCPITESSLGDGIFDGRAFLESGGRFGIGSDSNIRIALGEELRTLEYSQRLRERARAVLASPERSAGRTLFEGAARGGGQAAGRDAGAIEAGRLADLVALDKNAIAIEGKRGDTILDCLVFAGGDRIVTDVWSAGRHVVSGGAHRHHDAITERYRATVRKLGNDL